MGFVKFITYWILVIVACSVFFGLRVDDNFMWLGVCVMAAGAIAYSRKDE